MDNRLSRPAEPPRSPTEVNPYDPPNKDDSRTASDHGPFRDLAAVVPDLERQAISVFASIASVIALIAWAIFIEFHIGERFQPNMGFWIIPHYGLALLASCAVAPFTYRSASALRRRVVRPLYLLGFFPCFLLPPPCIRLIDYTLVEQWNFIPIAVVFAGVFAVPAVCAGLTCAGLLSVLAMFLVRHKGGEPSDAPKDRASRFDNGSHNAGPR